MNQSERMVLLITDRREDPITPLLNQWTYQAMMHELISITNNRILLKSQKESEKQEFVVSCTQDEFYNLNIFSNFGDLAVNIKDYINQMTQQRQQTVKIESIEDMQKVLDQLPEL